MIPKFCRQKSFKRRQKMLKMEPFMAVLEDLECKIFFVTQPWWSTFIRSGEEGTGGIRKGGGRERRGREDRHYEKIISCPALDSLVLLTCL